MQIRRPRTVKVNPRVRTEVIGLRSAAITDLYYLFLKSSWLYLFGFITFGYVSLNLIFAAAYESLGDCIANARPGSFWDAFFFSVQTVSTVGYGHLYPACASVDAIATLESICGLMGFAVVTGIAFNKFARPQARIQYSRVAVVNRFDGVPTFMFRVANKRANYVAEATASLTMLRPGLTKEGRPFTRMIDLPLIRQRSSMFNLTWTVMHQITPESPLYGQSAETMRGSRIFFIGTITGFDETMGQTIHARHAYQAEDIVWDSRFVDILHPHPSGKGNLVDYRHFHAVESDG